MPRRFIRFAVTAVLLTATITAPGMAHNGARQSFLTRMDTALASRDASQIAALADTTSWLGAGHPALESLRMTLPKAPLIRDGDLSETAVRYRDGDGRLWRLAMRHDESTDGWSAVIRSRPCPRGGTQFRPDFRAEPSAAPRTETWTVLECWPLPK